MMRTKLIFSACGLCTVIVSIFSACKKDSVETSSTPFTQTPYDLKVPAGFPKPIIPSFNPLTVEGVTLGHRLYYDNILSSNGLSCSSCHSSEKSYSSPLFLTKTGEKISVPPHVNIAWNTEYNWEGNEPVLDLLCKGDFGPDFFNTNMADLVRKLKTHAEYPKMFREAFNIIDIAKLSDDELQTKIAYAITQFMRTMISSNSKFDRYMRHEGMLSMDEFDGMETFMTEKGDCFHCHGYPLMTSNTFNNNGLDTIFTGLSLGRYNVTKKESDKGKFSAPTLRNIELTAPYMHDGRFGTLEEVVDHYDHRAHWNSPNIDPLMTKPFKQYGLNLSPEKKANLVKFLKTLTDTAFINNAAFRRP